MSEPESSESASGRLASAIESILLVAGGPVTFRALSAALGEPRGAVGAALAVLGDRAGGIRIQREGDEVRLVTAPENDEIVRRFLGTEKPPPLPRSQLETLTVIAYRQPVTRADIEAARGANSDRPVQALLARGLIEERGARQSLGRPMQYGTGFSFLEYFGLRSLDDLPPLPGDADDEMSSSRLGLRPVQRELPETERGSQDEA